MGKILMVFGILLVMGIIGIALFVIKNPNSPLIPYNPKGTTVQTETNRNSLGNPVRQVDQANDASRTDIINNLEIALKQYYATNQKSPDSLEELVTQGLIRRVKTDPVTKELPRYTATDTQRGCKVELMLSDGSNATGWCK